jgi:hypothetical protein
MQCWPPTPASILNQKPTPLEIPTLRFGLPESCSKGEATEFYPPLTREVLVSSAESYDCLVTGPLGGYAIIYEAVGELYTAGEPHSPSLTAARICGGTMASRIGAENPMEHNGKRTSCRVFRELSESFTLLARHTLLSVYRGEVTVPMTERTKVENLERAFLRRPWDERRRWILHSEFSNPWICA